MITIQKRFWKKVNKTSGCWLWTGARSGGNKKSGEYGYFRGKTKMVYAHRFAYELFKESIPKGNEIDHRCKNKLCCNPDHLQIVTHRENMLRASGPVSENAAKTHCKRGHEFTSENTNKLTKWRRCNTCIQSYMKDYFQKRKKGRIS